eukprot:CAMPEP_0184861704 /NCGR_PEP_ID=MMETSP0580-20130426/6323_1 /TAXON_ID=1118495 /ORGANISM="Dactyliosolen fragilissimus" /LENGTH=677 /DNA_ID=CAMNT_0027359291 /DNA_START=408 /DNA_END=2441 /DNA_ORIENTATION=-
MTTMDYESINKLSYRQLQTHCKEKGLPATGNTATLRGRLLEEFGLGVGFSNYSSSETSSIPEVSDEDCEVEGIEFCDESDKDFEFKSLLTEVMEKASMGHWKAATRKLKKLNKRYATPSLPVPHEAYLKVLETCITDRLHGARASEPARKILEEMTAQGYEIPSDMGNKCVISCLGYGANGTHDGFGGIDTALAMLAAMEANTQSPNIVNVDAYGTVVSALARDKSVEEAIILLRVMVVERSFTPPLSIFADVGSAAANLNTEEGGEFVLQVMALAKAAGYQLDNIASVEAGRELLASGLIAAEQMDNLALGLRLLTAAGKAEGCAPDRGDDLVSSSSSKAQRASTLIHKRAIDKSLEDDNWKLAVKLLELMSLRSLKPSTSVWRKVVTLCAKCNKSRKATSLLLDWVKFSKEKEADMPPLKVFNTVVNACEICGEEELTLAVLDTMKETHDTDGNIITFNIALKRLAKLGNVDSCEGIIVGMLQAGQEPNVVSYTTAIGACVQAKDSKYAYEWLKRMRSRNVQPNFHTYNTALASCLDGKLDSTVRASLIANEMLTDVQEELMNGGVKGSADYLSVIPDKYTKVLARNVMKQLRENWRSGDINMAVAKSTVRVPLLKLVDFDKSEAANMIAEQRKKEKEQRRAEDECDIDSEECEAEIDFNAVNMLHKENARTMEV